jgi:hypothetical protein
MREIIISVSDPKSGELTRQTFTIGENIQYIHITHLDKDTLESSEIGVLNIGLVIVDPPGYDQTIPVPPPQPKATMDDPLEMTPGKWPKF